MGQKKAKKDVTVHDFRQRTWGHDYTYEPNDGGLSGLVLGWCTPLPRKGDLLILENRNSPDFGTRYRVDAVRSYADPTDMFAASVTYVRWAYTKDGVPVGPWDEVSL